MKCTTLRCSSPATGRVRVTFRESVSLQAALSFISEPICDAHQGEICIHMRRRHESSVSVCAVPLDYELRLAQARRTESLL